jgi:hypothetical protein
MNGWSDLAAGAPALGGTVQRHAEGRTIRQSEMGVGHPPDTEFLLDGRSIAGAWAMNPMVPAEQLSYRQIYFTVEDVDAVLREVVLILVSVIPVYIATLIRSGESVGKL